MVYNILYQLLEQSKFTEVLELLESQATCQHFTEEQHNSNLPLHISLKVDAPDEIILQILHLNEDAAWCKGDESNLPLHIATKRNSSPEVIERLIRVNPKSLDARNAEGFTPREIGHSDPYAHQALLRPTFCWLELLDDEEREERQDSRLLLLHNKIDGGLDALRTTNHNVDNIISRLEHLDANLENMGQEKVSYMEDKLSSLESTIIAKFDHAENELCMMEDDIKSLYTKELMSKIACEATSTEVRKMQRSAEVKAEYFMKDVRDLKNILLT